MSKESEQTAYRDLASDSRYKEAVDRVTREASQLFQNAALLGHRHVTDERMRELIQSALLPGMTLISAEFNGDVIDITIQSNKPVNVPGLTWSVVPATQDEKG